MVRWIDNRRMAGYFTIEASLIVPYVFALIMLSILLSFFLYNHCILFQSCYIAALRGQQLKEVSDEGVERYVNEELAKLLDEQLYQYQFDGRAEVSLTTIYVKAESFIDNTLKEFGLYSDERFESKRSVKVVRINPSETIRRKYSFFR